MKRIICVLTSVILVSVIAVGCTQKLTPPEPVKSSEKSSQKASEPSVPEVDESWKEPMKEDYYADSFFGIVYIDDFLSEHCVE